MILLPRGASIREVTNHSYKRVTVLPVLGHQISDNASLAPDWNATRSSLWKAFWANAGSKCVRCAHIDQKMRLIERAVTSVANFRWSRWAPQKQLANDLNRIQSKMCAIVQNIRPRPRGRGSFCLEPEEMESRCPVGSRAWFVERQVVLQSPEMG